MDSGTIYAQAEFAKVDIGLQMRFGHPFISEGDDIIVELCRRHAARHDRPLRILEIGSGSGYLIELLHKAIPDAELVANEFEPALVDLARERFRDTPVTVFGEPFEKWDRPVDIVISWGAYHHMVESPTHLAHAAALLGTTGTLILGDEFCPDYLVDEDRARLATAESVHIADGHLLLHAAEIAEFDKTGELPDWSKALEARRRRALWTWYKYVIDVAFERGDDVVVNAELQIAADDIRTEFAGEHKLALPIVVRDLELNGFSEQSRVALASDPALASFFVLELGHGR